MVDTTTSLLHSVDDTSTTSRGSRHDHRNRSVPVRDHRTYTLDPAHSRIGFVARHAMVTKVRGSFNEFTASGRFDAENPANSRLELTVRASIDTRNADRDAHLRSNDFFAMDQYPEITYRLDRGPAGGR